MKLTLYRGITIKPEEAETVRKRILKEGLSYGQGRLWSFECVDLRPRLNQLLKKTDLTTEDTRPSIKIDDGNGNWHMELINGYPSVCACADLLGASYYALKHNQLVHEGITHGLVVKFRASLSDLSVDGRDFLYNSVFRDAKNSAQREMACKLFGDKLGPYLDLAMGNAKLSYKFAMCDLAVQDDEVISEHARNDVVIGGRYGTVFKSAFFVKVPVAASDIISVDDAKDQLFEPQVTLNDFRLLTN